MGSNPYIYTKLPNGQVARLARGGSASGGVSGGGGTGQEWGKLAEKPTGGTASTPTIIASLPATTTTAVDNLVKQAADNQKPIATTTPSSSTTTTSTPSTTTTATTNPYDAMYAQLQQMLTDNATAAEKAARERYAQLEAKQLENDQKWDAGQQEVRDAYIKRAEENQAADTAASNTQYDRNARQNYINYMQAQKQLPSQLNALGIRGGAAESSLIRLGSNYGTNVANNEMARAQALDAIAKQYSDQINEYQMAYTQARLAREDSTATMLAQALNNLNETLANITSARDEAITNAYTSLTSNGIEWTQHQEELAKAEQQRLDDIAREDRLRAEEIARADEQRKEDIARENARYAIDDERYQTEWLANQQQQELSNWKDSIQGLSRNRLEKLLKQVKSSDDPNKELKLNYLRALINQSGSSSSGGGSSRSRTGGSSYSGGGDDNSGGDTESTAASIIRRTLQAAEDTESAITGKKKNSGSPNR